MKFFRKFIGFDTVLVFVCALAIFALIVLCMSSDIELHSGRVIDINNGEATYPANFLYFLLLNICSFFSNEPNRVYAGAVFVLANCVAAKYMVTRWVFADFFRTNGIVVQAIVTKLMAGAMLLFFTVPSLRNALYLIVPYRGRIVPNVWHNSTTICVFPFAIALFWLQYKVLTSTEDVKWSQILAILGLIVLNAIIKPSFLFVFIPVTGLILLWKYRFSLALVKNVIPLVGGSAIVLLLYLLIYHTTPTSVNVERHSLHLSYPFEIMRRNGGSVPSSLFLSFCLPLAYFCCFPRSIRSTLFVQAVGQMVLGVLIYAFIYEEGPRKFHGNFFWQNVLCMHLLLMAIVADLMAKYFRGELSERKKAFFSVLVGLHVLAGIVYLIRMMLVGGYH